MKLCKLEYLAFCKLRFVNIPIPIRTIYSRIRRQYIYNYFENLSFLGKKINIFNNNRDRLYYNNRYQLVYNPTITFNELESLYDDECILRINKNININSLQQAQFLFYKEKEICTIIFNILYIGINHLNFIRDSNIMTKDIIYTVEIYSSFKCKLSVYQTIMVIREDNSIEFYDYTYKPNKTNYISNRYNKDDRINVREIIKLVNLKYIPIS